ncbi:MAG: 30S ribosomal protein S17 [Phycisphaera sp.]|nr:MAG: 30S ribosomal protein S17 [Phycisphaera sp.]
MSEQSTKESKTKTLQGTVESDKRDKSRRVVVNFMTKHPKYGKYVKGRTVLQVHDGNNESKMGDLVEVRQCKPVSKTKSWELVKVIRSGGLV